MSRRRQFPFDFKVQVSDQYGDRKIFYIEAKDLQHAAKIVRNMGYKGKEFLIERP